MSNEEEAKRAADQRTIAVLLIVVVVAHGLLGLMALVLPQVLGVVLVIAGIGWFALLHYVLWGWWLGGYLRRLADEESRKESGDRDQESEKN